MATLPDQATGDAEAPYDEDAGQEDELQAPTIPAILAVQAAGPEDEDTRKDKRISHGKGRPIADLIKPIVPDGVRQKHFGRWLMKDHKGLDEHDHFDQLEGELEHLVREWQDGEGKGGMTEREREIRDERERMERERPRKPTRGTGGSEGGGNDRHPRPTPDNTPDQGPPGGTQDHPKPKTPKPATTGTPTKPATTGTPTKDHGSDDDDRDKERARRRKKKRERDRRNRDRR
jgi:hypothetical protein